MTWLHKKKLTLWPSLATTRTQYMHSTNSHLVLLPWCLLSGFSVLTGGLDFVEIQFHVSLSLGLYNYRWNFILCRNSRMFLSPTSPPSFSWWWGSTALWPYHFFFLVNRDNFIATGSITSISLSTITTVLESLSVHWIPDIGLLTVSSKSFLQRGNRRILPVFTLIFFCK